MRACLALLLLLLAVESRAAVGIDGANFPNGIQSHSATGVVEFGWQGVLETDNRQLRAGSIVQNTSQSPATCGSLGFCQAVAPPAPTQEPGAFPSTSGTQDVTLGYQQSGSLSGDGSNQYRRIQVGQEATLTINSGGQAFYIDRLDLGYRATLVLGSGDYWINDLNFDGSEVRVFIPAGNQVRLFVNAQVTVSYRTVLNYRDLNTPGTPDQLFIYAYNDFRIDNQVVTPAYLYSRSDFRLGNVATLRGAVTARNVTLDSSGARVIFALQMNPVGAQIDHIRIEHDGSALTCQPESVTVKACMDANCTSTYPDPVTVTLTPAAGWVGGNVLALTGASAAASTGARPLAASPSASPRSARRSSRSARPSAPMAGS